MRLLHFIRKKSKEAEYSVPLRRVVLAAMLIPLLALARVNSFLWPHVILAAMGICLGHWYSFHNLKKQSQIMRGVMFIAIHLALCWMFIGLIGGAVVPQAQFAIFAQAITSFDLRYRASLFNTLIHSLAILYVAASLSRTTELAIFLILFAVLVLAAFFVADKESGLKFAKIRPKFIRANSIWKVGRLEEGALATFQPSIFQLSKTKSLLLPPQARSMMLFGFSFGVVALLVIFIVFLLTPRFANRPIVPPFSLNIPLNGGIQAEIINPGVPLVQINGWSNGSSDYYYGFDTSLDLRYRGGLSDEIVMYVRSPSHSYWRSHSYDFYDGVSWSQSDKTLTDVDGRGVYYQLPAPLGGPESQQIVGTPTGRDRLAWRSPSPRRHVQEALNVDLSAPSNHWENNQQVVQTFTIVRDQPNLIFAAYRPSEIFISTESISLDRGDSIRLPEPLKAGMTYSVVSYRPDFDPDTLRQITSTDYPADIAGRYLQLPPNISERVKALARTLTGLQANTFDKALALNEHLQTNYPYNFFPPPHPPGAEVVDTFLFEDGQGVCEQYVTALVVMARSLGIPARLVAGYGPGDYNPITGYYEVRFSQAHSWAEIYFPGQGWVPFDPTPGWAPQPYPTPVQNWLLANNGQLLSQITGLNLPISAIVSGGLNGLIFFAPFLAVSALLVGLAMLLIFLAQRLRQMAARRATNRYSQLTGDPTRRLILKIYHQALRFLRRKKRDQRQPWETVTEYANRIGNPAAFSRLGQLAEIAAYRPQAPDHAAISEAQAALASLKQELSEM